MPKLVTTTANASPKTRKYKLLSGKHFGRDENGNELEYSKGEMVPLTEAQYENFKDKFEGPNTSGEEVAEKAPEPVPGKEEKKGEGSKDPNAQANK